MSTESKNGNATTVLVTVGLLLISVLCCAIPFLVGAGAVGLLGGLSVAAGNVGVTAAVIIIAIVGIGWLLVRRARKTEAADTCCAPQATAPPRDAVDHTDRAAR